MLRSAFDGEPDLGRVEVEMMEEEARRRRVSNRPPLVPKTRTYFAATYRSMLVLQSRAMRGRWV